MIFKRWFKPKWQHESAAVRQLAIASLDHSTPQQKEILHELAFNDAAEAVRRTALERLNEFSLWWQASKHEQAERLKQFAEQQLIQMLLENKVSSHLKQQFIAECHRSSILEKLAQAETDPTLKFQLLLRLNREDLYISSVLDPVLTAAQRIELLALIQEEKALDKLSRQVDGDIAIALQQLLAERLEQKQKPERVRKQVVLLLAKLNALREKTDIAEIQQRLAQHQQEWQQLLPDLPCLSDQDEFVAKYEKVIELTNKSLQPRLEAFELALQKQQKQQQELQQFVQFEQQLQLLAEQLSVKLAAGELEQAQQLLVPVEQLAAQIAAAALNAHQQQQLQKQVRELINQLARLPVLAEALAQAARLLAELAAQGLPQPDADVAGAYQGFKQWQQQWQRQSKVLQNFLPVTFSDSYQQLCQQWRQHCEPLLAQQDKQLRQLKSKIAEFKRLHQAGKFNVLFGLFKGIQTDLQALLPSQQQSLQKDVELLEKQIQDLSELQAYIATPRKKELLAQIQELASQTDVVATQRSAEVKQARAVWNSLGRADAALEQQLNDDFNQACELAFAPCREHFARLDAERQQHAEQKQQIIAQLSDAVTAQIAGKELDTLLSQAIKNWQATGPVEKSVYATLQPQFQQLLDQLRQMQKTGQQQHAQAKQALIAAATALTSQESTDNVAAQLKVLQSQWKQLGFAGRGLDQQLWTEFRNVCDAWFAKRDALREQQQQQQQQQYQLLDAELAQLEATVAASNEPAALRPLLQQLQALDTSAVAALQHRKQQLVQQLEAQLDQLAGAALQHNWRQLFDVLAQPDVKVTDVPAIYRLVFNQQQESLLSRADLTLALEWSAGVASPSAEQARRQQVQMLLLTDKHNSGESITQSQLLARWLQYGPVSATEQDLLRRVRALYLAD
jgi:hypothetical protein